MKRRCLNCMREFDIPDGQEHLSFNCPFCGYAENTPPKESTYLPPGTILQKRYIIGTTLGVGGFGITYRAWDCVLDLLVAIKEYYPVSMVQRIPGDTNLIVYSGAHAKEFSDGLERFLEEAQKMALFYESKNIVHVENHFEENHTAYIVMEFVDGISIKDFRKQEGGKIDWNLAVEISLMVADALKEIHEKGILHRDISPDNVFLCEGNRIKVLDFGAARLSDSEKERTRSIILKPGFAPPEQYESKSVQGPWTDIYALCAMLYLCVTGVMPSESTNRVTEDDVKEPRALNPEIPEYLSNTIMKGMAVDSRLRFQSIDELKKALQQEKKVLSERQELKKRRRFRVITIAATAVFLLCGSLAAWRFYDDRNQKLKAADITIWVSYDADGDAESAKAMIESMSETYQSDQPEVSISVEAISESEYADRLQEAEETGQMPTLYEAEYATDAMQEQAASVKSVYSKLNSLSDYYFLKTYKKELIEEKEVPLGFNLPVVYVSVVYDWPENTDINSFVLSSYEDVSSMCYLDSDYATMLINTLGGSVTYDDGLSVSDEAKTMIESERELTRNNSKLANDADALQAVKDGTTPYYLASMQEFSVFNSQAGGYYELRPIETEQVYGEFTDVYSIDGAASADEIKAAQTWLRYMLDEGPQKIYHVENKHAIPLQKDAYDEYVSIDTKLDEILDSYMDTVKLQSRNQFMIKRYMDDLWKQVVIERSCTLDEWIDKQ